MNILRFKTAIEATKKVVQSAPGVNIGSLFPNIHGMGDMFNTSPKPGQEHLFGDMEQS